MGTFFDRIFRSSIAHLVLIALVVSAVFVNTLPNDFHLDDHYLVKDNPGVQGIHPVWRHFLDPRTISTLDRITQYRPMLPLTMSFSHALGGFEPPWYHALSIVFHIFTCFIAYALVLELLKHWQSNSALRDGRCWIALSVALVLGVHPVSGFLINYIAARDVILMQLFLSLALLSYVRMRRLGVNWWRFLLASLALLLALFSKTNAVVAPGLVLVFELTLGYRSLRNRSLWLAPLPFAAVVAAHMAFKRFYLGFSDFTNAIVSDASIWRYPLTQAKLHTFEYLRNFVWPFELRLMPDVRYAQSFFETEVLIGSLVIVISLLLAAKWWRRSPLKSFCILSYWTVLVPTSSVLALFYAVAHYRTYPASVFLYLIVAVLVTELSRKRLLTLFAAVTLLYFSYSSITINRTWLTEESAYEHSIRYGADPLAHMNYAMSLPDRRDPRVQKHLELALMRGPGSVLSHINLGLLYMDLGRADEGFALVKRGAEMRPDWAQGQYWLSVAHDRRGEQEAAVMAAVNAANLDTRNVEYQYRAAVKLQDQQAFEDSLEFLIRAEAISPDFQDVGFLKGFSQQMLGLREDAIASYRSFLERKPEHSGALYNLGIALRAKGDCEQAVPHLLSVVAKEPRHQGAHFHLAECFRVRGDQERAEYHTEQHELANRMGS